MGEEPYFIDMLAERLGETILSPEERAFDQTVVYGRDTEAGAIVNFCRQMPMMGAFQVVIVREAQTLRRIDQLSLYTSAPSPTTILVLCHKEKGLDKRSQLYKQIEAKGAVFESSLRAITRSPVGSAISSAVKDVRSTRKRQPC